MLDVGNGAARKAFPPHPARKYFVLKRRRRRP